MAVNSLILFAPDMESREFFGNVLGPLTAGVAASFAIVIVARQGISGLFGKTYGSLAIGLVLWLIAESIWSYHAIGQQIAVPFPSLADAFWLAGYMPLGYHLFVTAKFYGRVKTSTLIMVSVAAAIFATAYVNDLIESSTLAETDGLLPLAITIAYPVLDVVMVIPAVMILINPVRGQLTSIPWIFISWLFTTSADAMFGHTAISNLAAEITLWNLLYNAAYICMAAGLFWYNKFVIYDEKELNDIWLRENK
jgi:hypothetical protein